MNAPSINLYTPVKNAIKTLINEYVEAAKLHGSNATQTLADAYTARLDELLLSHEPFLAKVTTLDTLAAEFNIFSPLKEYLFDLLLTNFLAAEVHLLGDEYLESAEWQKIEDETLHRGTELFNLLLYINEAIDDDVEISLDDFLREFLLTEEDEFQDEHTLYEGLISNQELLDAETSEVIKVWKQEVRNKSEIEDLFIPILLFFADPEVLMAEQESVRLLQHDKEISPEQPALLQAIFSFKNGFHDSISIHSN
jgi:hypothetical protein